MFETLTAHLISRTRFGIPEHVVTLAAWIHTLRTFVALLQNRVSVYNSRIEGGSVGEHCHYFQTFNFSRIHVIRDWNFDWRLLRLRCSTWRSFLCVRFRTQGVLEYRLTLRIIHVSVVLLGLTFTLRISVRSSDSVFG